MIIRTISVYAVIAGCTASMLVGCGQPQHEVTFQSGGMTHIMKEGEAAEQQSDFPLPFYPNSETTGSVQAKGGSDEDSHFVMLNSIDPADKIAQFYNEKLKESGWTLQPSAASLPNLMQIDAKKGELEANITVSENNGRTSITLSVNKEPAIMPPPSPSDPNVKPDNLNPPTD